MVKILVVDDELMIRELLSLRLVSEGYEVVTASDGEEALQKLQENNGITFYSKICLAGGKPRVPVLMLTARGNLEPLFKDLDVKYRTRSGGDALSG